MKLLKAVVVVISFCLFNVACVAAVTDPLAPPVDPQKLAATALKNKTEGEAFLKENKMKPGVVTLPDGLQYRVMVEGQGAQPTMEDDTVTVDYSGTLTNGTEFDSSYSRGQPFTFELHNVITGWVEALLKMKVGSVWEIYIPSNLAYGEKGAPPMIGPNQTLIFTVKLLEVQQAS